MLIKNIKCARLLASICPIVFSTCAGICHADSISVDMESYASIGGVGEVYHRFTSDNDGVMGSNPQSWSTISWRGVDAQEVWFDNSSTGQPELYGSVNVGLSFELTVSNDDIYGVLYTGGELSLLNLSAVVTSCENTGGYADACNDIAIGSNYPVGNVWGSVAEPLDPVSFANNQWLFRTSVQSSGMVTDSAYLITLHTCLDFDVCVSRDHTIDEFSPIPSPVPLPATAWLFGSALLPLIARGRLKKLRAAAAI